MMQQHNERPEELAEADRIYEQYAKALETDHLGQFVAVTGDGVMLLGDSVHSVMDQLLATVGPGSGSYIFKIGERSVGKWL